jgi:hypothetical protein
MKDTEKKKRKTYKRETERQKDKINRTCFSERTEALVSACSVSTPSKAAGFRVAGIPNLLAFAAAEP